MKHHLSQFYGGKKLGMLIFLFAFCFILYQEIKPLLSYLTAQQAENEISSLHTTTPELVSKEIAPANIDISQVNIDQLEPVANNDYKSPIFAVHGTQYQITYQDLEISHLQLSPDKKIIGFYIDPSQDSILLNEVDLVLMNMKNKTFKEISEGDLKVSNWEWKNNREFIIYINCGSGCHLAHVHSVIDGSLVAEYLEPVSGY